MDGSSQPGLQPDASRHDSALEAALERLVPGQRLTRPDTPDLHVTAVRRLPPSPARLVPFPSALDGRLQRALEARGISSLYTHQAAAIDHALAGRNVVVTTPTASGKTLCYNAPILHAILRDPSSRALYLFPTKALAQDQLAELQGLCGTLAASDGEAIGVSTYDGDTPQDARRTIRGRAHLVLSNPDMLHSGILPHHPRWAKLFENLRYVVIDELHAYRGVFGSHLGNVLRRLHRVCRHYGSDPVFVCSSATIANPRELAERLVERPFELVDESGAPRGEKFFVFVNPPVVNRQLGIRRSYLSETRRVATEFLKRRLQLIAFTQSRLSTEILTTYLKDDFEEPPPGPERIRGYRGGYLPGRRREIEKGLRDGVVRAVVSTNALELGIDIGALDVCLMAGYPGTIASTWQRAGRAGRRTGRSAAVLVASSAPLDQFVVRNPSYFFEASPERALVDPDNLHILVDHVKCAAFELPFESSETFGRHDLQQILEILAEQGLVHRQSSEAGSLRSRPRNSEVEGASDGAGGGAPQPSPEAESLRSRPREGEVERASGGGAPREVERWTWTSESYPADAVSLRKVSSDNFVVVDTTGEPCVIGETDFTSGPSTLHPKAIYIVEAKLYQVERLDFEGRKAFVREIDCDYYTDAITYTKVTILDTCEADTAARAHGDVHVVSRVVGFKKIKFYTNENVGSGELDLPEQQMHTTAYWLTVPSHVLSRLPYASDDRRDGIAGLSFAMRQVAQLLLMCDRHDIGISVDLAPEAESLRSRPRDCEARPASGGAASAPSALRRASPEPEDVVDGRRRGGPRIFVFDNYPGGIGFSEPLYRMHQELLEGTRGLVAGCRCEHGCPSCVGPVGNPLAKAAALRILDLLIEGTASAV